jgi:hypothetical protein
VTGNVRGEQQESVRVGVRLRLASRPPAWCMLRTIWLWTRMRGWIVILSIGMAACGGFKDSLEDSKRATGALKSELGLDAQVSLER